MMNQNILIKNSTTSNGVTAKVDLTVSLEKEHTSENQGMKRLLSPEEAETAAERTARLTAAANLSEESTYEKLKAAALSTYMKYAVDGRLTGETKPIRAPKAEHLMKSEAKILITGTSGEMEMSVYDNGFFIAKDTTDPEQHMTVGSVERVISRLGADKGSEEDLDKAMKLPWTLILSMDAQIRLDHNEENREADRTDLAIRGDGSDTAGGMKVPDHVTQLAEEHREEQFRKMKEAMLKKLPRALDALREHSEKQWVAVTKRLYRVSPVPYKEIAAELGVKESRVNVLMNKGVSFMQKYMDADEEMVTLITAYME